MNSWIERLGWTLVHSLWQFGLIALVAGALLRALRGHSANLRHGWLVAALAAVTLAPAATWAMLAWNAASVVSVASASDVPQAAPLVGPASPQVDSATETGAAGASTANSRSVDSPAEPPAHGSPNSQEPRFPFNSIKSAGDADWAPAGLSWTKCLSWGVRPWLNWIVVAWSCGVSLGALRPLLGWWTLWRLRRVGVTRAASSLESAAARIARRLGLRRAVDVWESTLTCAPIVVGYLKPVVLLPASLAASIPAAQLEAILAHELAHVRRHDFLLNLAQTLLETLFFYHPAVWWLSRRLRIEREHCCDDLVVELFDNRVEYGRALVAVEELRGASPSLALSARDGSLLERIKRLAAGVKHSTPRRLERWPLAFATLLIAFGTFAVWQSLAVNLSAETPQEALIARFDQGPSVELLAVGTHQIWPQIWWTGRGDELAKRPLDPDARQVTFSSATNDGHQAECRELTFRVSDLAVDETQYLSYRWVFDGKAENYAHRAVVRGATEFTIGQSPPLRDGRLGPKVASVLVGIGELPDMFVVTIGRDGRKVEQPVEGDELRRLEDRVRPLRVGESNGEAELTLERVASNASLIVVEYPPVAIDRAGEVHELTRTAGDAQRAIWIYPLPLEQVERFEVRFRRYRHHAVFHRISLHPGQRSDARVTATSPKVTLAASQNNPAPNADDSLLREIDEAPLSVARQRIEKLDGDERPGLAAQARERLAARLARIVRQPREAFTRALPPGNPNDVNFGGERIGIQVDLDGVWSEGKGTAESWRDWIVRKQSGFRVERMRHLFDAARGYRQVDDLAAAERVLRAGLTGHEIFDAPWPALVRKYWPVKDDEPAKSMGSGPDAWTLVNFLTDLAAAQRELGRADEAVATQSRLTLAQFMLSWNQPSAGPTQAAREWWRLERSIALGANDSSPSATARAERLTNLIWFNVLGESNAKRTLDLSGAGERGQSLTYHHANVTASPALDFRELKVSAEISGKIGFLDCYRINSEGRHESLGRLETNADGKSLTVTKSISVPAGTGLVQFMVAGDAVRVGKVTVEATFSRRADNSK